MSRLWIPAFLLLVPLTAAGGALAPRKASEIVKLTQSGGLCPIAGYALDNRALPTGATVDYTNPAGQVLVVTGLEWSGDAGAPGARVTLSLTSQTASNVAGHYSSSTTFASDGKFFDSEPTPPFVIKGGRTVCAFLTAGSFNAASVHGFLAPDK